MRPKETGILVGDFTFIAASGELSRDEEVHRLRPQAARALATLVERAGQVVSRADLQRIVWPNTKVEYDLSLNVCIRQVRSALGDDAECPDYIETLPRRGYRLIAPVQPVREAAVPPTSRRTRRWPAVAAIGFALAAAIIFSSTGRRQEIRIAILPFELIATDQDLEHIEYGVAEELITVLANIHPDRLAVIGKQSSFGLAEQGLHPVIIGERLDADFIIEGAVRQVANRFRVTVQLLDVSRDTYAWSQSFDVNAAELSLLDRRLTASVTQALQDRLGIVPNNMPVFSSNPDPDVREALLRSRVLLAKFSRPDAHEAVRILKSTLVRDSLDADLLVNLAAAHLQLGKLADADQALAQARAIDPNARDLDHTAGQVALFGHGKPLLALEHLERAIAQQPGAADLHRIYAFALVANGQADQAVAHGERALDLDPVSSTARGDVGWVYYYASRYADAERVCRSTLELTPESVSARECAVLAAALAGQIHRTADLIPELLPSLMATDDDIATMTRAVQNGYADSLWQWLLGSDERLARLGLVQQARVFALADRDDDALHSLMSAARNGPRSVLFAVSDPAFANIRNTPKFKTMFSEIGLLGASPE